MRVECSNCHKVFDIPDERLPKGKQIAFPCPACQESIQLDLRAESGQAGASSSQTEQRDLPKGDALKKKILRTVKNLPPMPQSVLKAREIMANPNSDFKELAELLETDQAIAARVLKLANSSYYGLSGKVSSIQHASVVLGHKALAELITMGGTASILGNTLGGYGLEAGDLWRHSLGVAFGSRIIANRKNPELSNDAFASGLIHDSGKLILDPHILERKELFHEFMANGQQSFLAAEKQILEFDHSEIASEVCKNWNIPQALTIAIRYHHYPSRSQGNQLAYIVHMADAISMMTGLGLGVDGMHYQIDDDAMEFLDLQEEDLNVIMEEVLESVQKISEQMH
ncbi:MAG: zinc-ribbon domain-containing protein [Proteobacteria bacterium]|nr:zinc-ribbon domain-containing protein [Pseudomonadota bacterium]